MKSGGKRALWLFWCTEWPLWVLLAMLCALTILTWISAPPVMVLHLNPTGGVSRYGSKHELLLLPMVGVVAYFGMRASPQMLRLAALGLLVLASDFLLLPTAAAAVSDVPLVTGVLLVVLGSAVGVMAVVRIRVPWTADRAHVETHAQRLAAWMLGAMGLVQITLAVTEPSWALASAVVLVPCVPVGVAAYSYLIWRHDSDRVSAGPAGQPDTGR